MLQLNHKNIQYGRRICIREGIFNIMNPENKIHITIPEDEHWENLKISNDFIFAKVMRNPELCKGLLERLLDIKIDHIEYPEEQKAIDIAKDSKSVRLDVYLKDGNGTVYNVEIQTTSNKNLPKRTRYYAGMIDLNEIEKGADYNRLPKSFVIFICTFDVFGRGRWKYTFQNVCMEDKKLLLNDGTVKIFFNTTGTKGRINKDTKNILEFIEGGAAGDGFTGKLEQEVIKIKENKEWQVEYMTLMMREREKYNEGKIEGAVITYKEVGVSFNETIHRIAEKFNLSLYEAEENVKKYWI